MSTNSTRLKQTLNGGGDAVTVPAGRVDVRFVTGIEKYAVPDAPIQIALNHTTDELNLLVNGLLKESTYGEHEDVTFDFLLNGHLIRETIEEHLKRTKSTDLEIDAETGKLDLVPDEDVIEIEVILKHGAPSPFECLKHNDWVSGVSVLGDVILTGCYDASLNLWRVSNDGKSIEHLINVPGHTSSVKDVKWVRNRDQLTSLGLVKSDAEHVFVSVSNDETGILWRWTADSSNQIECVAVLRGHIRSVESVAVFDDLIVTGGYDNMVKIWSLTSDGENLEKVNGITNETNSKNTKSTKAKRAKITGDELDEEEEDETEEMDGKDGTIRKGRAPMMTLAGHSEAVSDVGWLTGSDSTTAVSCSMDHTIKLWDIEIVENKQTLASSKPFTSLSVSPNATGNASCPIITGSCDRHVRLWDPRSTEGSMVKQTFSSHTGWVTCVTWAPDGNPNLFLSGSYDGVTKLWDVRSPRAPLYDLLGHDGRVMCVDWSNEKFMVSGAQDNQVKIYRK